MTLLVGSQNAIGKLHLNHREILNVDVGMQAGLGMRRPTSVLIKPVFVLHPAVAISHAAVHPEMAETVNDTRNTAS